MASECSFLLPPYTKKGTSWMETSLRSSACVCVRRFSRKKRWLYALARRELSQGCKWQASKWRKSSSETFSDSPSVGFIEFNFWQVRVAGANVISVTSAQRQRGRTLTQKKKRKSARVLLFFALFPLSQQIIASGRRALSLVQRNCVCLAGAINSWSLFCIGPESVT